MKRGITLCVLAALGLGAACSREPSSTAARLAVEGAAEVAGVGEPWRPVTGDRDLSLGDQVRVLDGSAVISLSDDRKLELRKGSELTLGVDSQAELLPVLRAGDLLVDVPAGSITVSAADTGADATVKNGAARVSRGLAVVVGSYSASVLLESAGRSITLESLRQADVPAAGLLPSRASPLSYSPTDAWDQRFLSEALQLREPLVARSLGFTAQLRPGQETGPDFYRQLLPALSETPGFDGSVLNPSWEPGESLVGLTIALAGTEGTFLERWRDVGAFHTLGADWGLVALDQSVPRVPLLAAIDEAIGRGPSLLSQPPAVAVTSPPPPGPAPSATPPSGGSSSLAAPAPPAPAAPTRPGPTSAASPGPVRTGVDPVDTTANSLVELLSGLLSGLGGG